MIIKGKKGQWAHALSREYRSAQREQRVLLTYMLLKEKHSPEYIAVNLGVSTPTVNQYMREISANKPHFEAVYRETISQLKEAEQKRIKRLTRTNKEIIEEEGMSSILYALIFCLIALVWWWIPSIVWYVIDAGKSDITNWIYSWTGFPISLVVVAIITFFVKYSKAKREIEDYAEEVAKTKKHKK